MIPALLYSPIYYNLLLVLTLITAYQLYFNLTVLRVNKVKIENERWAWLFAILLSVFIGFRPISGVFVDTTTYAAVEDGLILNGSKQLVKGVMFYPPEYFCPYDYTTGRIKKTTSTFSIHWYAQTWIEPKMKLRLKITKPIRRIFGSNVFSCFKK